MTEQAGFKNTIDNPDEPKEITPVLPIIPEQRSGELKDDHGMFNPRNAGVVRSDPNTVPPLNAFDNPE